MQTSSIPTNPFAPPRIAAVEAESSQPQSATNRRASEKELQRLCWRLAIAEVSYVLGCATFIAGLSLFGGNYNLQAAAMFLQYGAFAVTWVCLFSIYRINHGIFRAIAAVVTFPVPLIGSLVFFFGSQHSNTFLRHNGYQRTFLGGKPDPEERQRMALNENYYPSARFDQQGNLRSQFDFTLISGCLIALFVFWLVTELS